MASPPSFLCAICLDDLTDASTLTCGHSFCIDHIRHWVNTRAADAPAPCPSCRAPISQRPEDMRVNTVMRDAIDAARGGGGASAASASASASTSKALARPPLIAYDDVAFDVNRRGQRVEIGAGTFSRVYSAKYHGDDVAVKVLVLPPTGVTPALEALFWREATLQYHLRHRSIAGLHGCLVDREEGGSAGAGAGAGGGASAASSGAGGGISELGLVMPRFARSIDRALAASPPPPLEARLTWLAKIAGALRFLHARVIVHGDLKPANVLLDAAGAEPTICDFGHARLRREGEAASASLTGGAGGTPVYRDPCVSSGRNALRKASDVYSFGILGWQVVSGLAPYDGMDIAGVVAHTQAGGRPPLDRIPAEAPAFLAPLLARCWAAEQAARPTAEALCAAFGGAAAVPADGAPAADGRDAPLMRINVQMLTGRTLVLLGVKPSDCIRDLKAQIQADEGILTSQQRIIFGGHLLSNAETVGACGIKHDSRLHLVLRLRPDDVEPDSAGPMQIFVKRGGGASFTLDVQLSDSIAAVKAKIEAEEGRPFGDQRLALNGRVLEDDRSTIIDCRIVAGTVLDVLPAPWRAGADTIYVKTLAGKVLTIRVEPSIDIARIKAAIHEREAIPLFGMCLSHGGAELVDGRSLSDHGIERGVTLELSVSIPDVPWREGDDRLVSVTMATTGKVVPLRIEASCTVAEIKAKLTRERGGIPPSATLLVMRRTGGAGAQTLEDGRTLSFYNVRRRETLYLLDGRRGSKLVFITDMTGKTWSIQVEPTATAEDLKGLIQDRQGIPPEQQRLIFEGQQVEGRRALSSYGIECFDRLHLVLSLRGD